MLTAAELADQLGVARATIYDWTSYRKVPFYRLGGKGGPIRFDLEEVRSWLQGKRVAPLTEL